MKNFSTPEVSWSSMILSTQITHCLLDRWEIFNRIITAYSVIIFTLFKSPKTHFENDFLTCKFDKIFGQSCSGTSLSILMTIPVYPPSGSSLICEGASDKARGKRRPKVNKVRVDKIIFDLERLYSGRWQLLFFEAWCKLGKSFSSCLFDQICHCIYFLMTRQTLESYPEKIFLRFFSLFRFFRLGWSTKTSFESSSRVVVTWRRRRTP